MKSQNQPSMTLRGSYAAPTCEMIDIRAERGLCLSYGSDHEGFTEEDWSGIWD